jgi:hypothetical protein
MKSTTWVDGISLKLDPNAIEDYRFDWNDWLGTETITNAMAIPTNCEAVVQFSAEGRVAVRVSNALPGAAATCRVTTNTGRVQDRTINFEVIER